MKFSRALIAQSLHMVVGGLDELMQSLPSTTEVKVVLPRPKHARSKTPSLRSVNGSRTVASKSHSTNHSETSTPCTKKPRSATVPSSFSFRSDERAPKHKEVTPKNPCSPNLGRKSAPRPVEDTQSPS
ncbi:hypothetical protein Tco_0845076 [Tanacetum coccineum]